MTDEAGAGAGAGGADSRVEMREAYRKQLLDGIGGWTGILITAIPPVVFVVVNALTELRTAVIAAIGTGVALFGYRLVRRQSVQQALSGLFGVVIASLIAARTGEARGYFLLGIWSSFVYGGIFAASMLARRPLVGVVWEFLEPSPGGEGTPPWYRRPVLLRAYLWATAAATGVFLVRGVVQLALYNRNATGWLAFARVSMGFPLWILAVGFGFWVVRRARTRLAGD